MSSFWTNFALVLTGWASEAFFVSIITTSSATIWFELLFVFVIFMITFIIIIPLWTTLFIGLWRILLLIELWMFALVRLLVLLSLILVYLISLLRHFSPVFALVDKYCPVALFCSIVFAKFLICWGLKFEGLASSLDNCSITHCVVPWLLKLNRKVSLWNVLCFSGLKLHKSQSLNFTVKII